MREFGCSLFLMAFLAPSWSGRLLRFVYMLFLSTLKPMTGLFVVSLSQGLFRVHAVACSWKRPMLQMSLVKYHLLSMSFGGFILTFMDLRPRGLVLRLGTTILCFCSSIKAGCVLR